MDVSFECNSVIINPKKNHTVIVEATGIDLQDVINSIGEDKFLDAIGRDYAVDHFGLELKE